jgi:hypothetical protein
MNRPNARRLCALVLLLAVLAAPASASDWSFTAPVVPGLGWLSDLWAVVVNELAGAFDKTTTTTSPAPAPPNSSSGLPPYTGGESGCGIDPNGQPIPCPR